MMNHVFYSDIEYTTENMKTISLIKGIRVKQISSFLSKECLSLY